jgi:hypothetical protein
MEAVGDDAADVAALCGTATGGGTRLPLGNLDRKSISPTSAPAMLHTLQKTYKKERNTSQRMTTPLVIGCKSADENRGLHAPVCVITTVRFSTVSHLKL